MSEKLGLDCQIDAAGQCRLDVTVHDANLLGKPATLEVNRHYATQASAGHEMREQVLQRSLVLEGPSQSLVIELPAGFYAYRGSLIHMTLEVALKVDDGLPFDTPVRKRLDFPKAPARNDTHAGDGAWIEPRDRFSLLANLAAIPPRNRLIVIGMMIVAVPIMLINLAIGFRDEFVPEPQVLFYDHSGADGGESPIEKALVNSGILGVGIWLTLLAQLRRYMRFEIAKAPQRAGRSDLILARDLIHGRARVPLQDIEVRVVACNIELGRQTQKRNNKTVDLRRPVRATVLFRQRIAYLPAEVPLEHYLAGELDLARLYDTLYPPHTAASHFGVDLQWEVQLIHPKFVDQEVALPKEWLVLEDFWLAAGSAAGARSALNA